MNNALDRIWIDTVKQDDIVFVLGDVSLNPKYADVRHLPGTKILLSGNHDKCFNWKNRSQESYQNQLKKYYDMGWNEIYQSYTMNLKDGTEVLLSHLPYNSKEGNEYDQRYNDCRPSDNGLILLHGHLHARYVKQDRLIDVGIDNNFTFYSEDDIIALIKDERKFIPSRLTEFYNDPLQYSTRQRHSNS